MKIQALRILSVALLLSAFASAQNVTGTVKNGTTNKPASGVEVVMVDPMQGMAEVSRGKADAQGRFSLNTPPAQGPHLVRATYQGANYFKMVPPGTTSAELTVYEAARELPGLNMTAENAFQAQGGTLQGAVFYVLHNNSNPPRTLAGERTFEFTIPDGATLESTDAQGPGGQAISINTTKQSGGRYVVNYPMRPGDTLVRVAYKMPYSGEASLAPRVTLPVDRFLVVLPTAMKFEGKSSGVFNTAPAEQGMTLQAASNVRPGQDLAFRISGTGVIEQAQDNSQQGADAGMGGQTGGGNTARPGGGLGPPIDAPDPLQRYRWPILGALVVALAGGGYMATRRAPEPVPAEAAEATITATSAPLARKGSTAPPVTTATATSTSSADVLLAAMKDELFQLEVERQQGVISPEEYNKNKAALDQTLQRALSRVKRA